MIKVSRREAGVRSKRLDQILSGLEYDVEKVLSPFQERTGVSFRGRLKVNSCLSAADTYGDFPCFDPYNAT
jgi:hypothetical protein